MYGYPYPCRIMPGDFEVSLGGVVLGFHGSSVAVAIINEGKPRVFILI